MSDPQTTEYAALMDQRHNGGIAPTLHELVASMQYEVDCDQAMSMPRLILLIARAAQFVDAEIGQEACRRLGEKCSYAAEAPI